MHSSDEKSGGLSPYLSTLGAVSLAFGCAVGCGAFVMPGTTFLPVAGPLGTLIGLGVGAGGVFLCGKPPALQVFAIVALAPWAFVGFESVSHSAEEFAFPRWRTVRIIVISLVVVTAAYAALTLVAASVHPPGFANWRDYVAARGIFDGLEATPVFYAGTKILGRPGLAILCATTFAAIMTGLVGNIVAASRLLYAMSRGLRRQSTPTQRSRTCQYTS